MPFIRSLASIYRILLTASISLNSKIISPYSYYAKKGLVYIIIIIPFSCQPSSYSKCTKANTCSLCDVCLVSINKYWVYIIQKVSVSFSTFKIRGRLVTKKNYNYNVNQPLLYIIRTRTYYFTI